MGTQAPEALSREGLFALVCDEAMKDGVLEPFERELLTRLAGFLKLSPDHARDALAEAKARFDRGELGTVRPLEPGALYAKALHVVMEDGVVDDLERKLLAGVRQLLGIDDEQHRCVMAGLRARMSRTLEPGVAEAVAAVERPSRSDAPEAAGGGSAVDFVLGALAVGAAAAMLLCCLVVVRGPGLLAFETLRHRVDPGRMTSGESVATPPRSEADPDFGMPGVEKLEPVALQGGARYWVGLETSGVGPRGGTGPSLVDVGMRLLVVNGETLHPVEVTTSVRDGCELCRTVSRTFFSFVPPATGSYVLMYNVTARDASFAAELYVTRYPVLSERSSWAMGGGAGAAVLVLLALVLGRRASGRARSRRPGSRRGAVASMEW